MSRQLWFGGPAGGQIETKSARSVGEGYDNRIPTYKSTSIQQQAAALVNRCGRCFKCEQCPDFIPCLNAYERVINSTDPKSRVAQKNIEKLREITEGKSE